MSILIRSRWSVATAAVCLIALSACSAEREGSGASSTAGDCQPSDELDAAYQEQWDADQQKLGLSDLDAPPIEFCEQDTSEYKKDEPEGGYKIALAAQGPTNSWALENEEAFKYAAEQAGAQVLYASADGDPTKQIDNIQQLTAQSPDAMVVVPMGPGITGQVKAAASQGIPVVLCAGRLEGDSGAIATVTRSYEMQGTLSAEWIAKQIGGKGKIAMLSGIAGVPTAEYQKAAAEKVFAKYPDIEVVDQQYTDWSPTKAKTVAANLAVSYPDLSAIWSDSAISDLGVLQAYTEAGLPIPPMTGDASNAFLKAAQGTDAQFALLPFPPEQSMECLQVALDALAGKPVPNVVNTDSDVFTHEQTEEYVRPECSDDLWIPSTLPDELLSSLNLC